MRLSFLSLILLLALPASAAAQFTGGAIRTQPRVVPMVTRPVEIEDQSNPTHAEADQRIESVFTQMWWQGLQGEPGDPLGGIEPVGDGYQRRYMNGTIYYRLPEPPVNEHHAPWQEEYPLDGASYVKGAIGALYVQLGGPDSWLGWPGITEEGAYDSKRGMIYYRRRRATFFHQPDEAVIEAFERGVIAQVFEHGVIFWHAATGAYECPRAEPDPYAWSSPPIVDCREGS